MKSFLIFVRSTDCLNVENIETLQKTDEHGGQCSRCIILPVHNVGLFVHFSSWICEFGWKQPQPGEAWGVSTGTWVRFLRLQRETNLAVHAPLEAWLILLEGEGVGRFHGNLPLDSPTRNENAHETWWNFHAHCLKQMALYFQCENVTRNKQRRSVAVRSWQSEAQSGRVGARVSNSLLMSFGVSGFCLCLVRCQIMYAWFSWSQCCFLCLYFKWKPHRTEQWKSRTSARKATQCRPICTQREVLYVFPVFLPPRTRKQEMDIWKGKLRVTLLEGKGVLYS